MRRHDRKAIERMVDRRVYAAFLLSLVIGVAKFWPY